jgi:hypothetical protein
MAADNYELDTSVLKRLIRNNPADLSSWLAGVAESMTNDIVLSMNTGPGGRTYIRGDKVHVASQENNPPNIDYSALVNSIDWEQMSLLMFHIHDGVEYGLLLEEGTTTMGPRPFIQPVFAEWQRKIEADALAYGLLKP